MKTKLSVLLILVSLNAGAENTPNSKKNHTNSTASNSSVIFKGETTSNLKAKDKILLENLKSTKGGQDTNGGVSVANPKGGRSLLDLMERDEAFPFDFKMDNYDTDLQNVYQENFMDVFPMLSQPIFDDVYNSAPIGGALKGGFAATLVSCMETGHWHDQTAFDFNATYAKNPFITISKQSLRWMFTDLPLNEINDSGIIRIVNPETKKQLAVQIGMTVIINRAEFDSLDNTSKAALKLHEGAICAVKQLNPGLIASQGTALIRYFVRIVTSHSKTKDQIEGTPRSSIIEAISELVPKIESKDIPSLSELKLSLPSYLPAQKFVCRGHLSSQKNIKPNVRFYCKGTWDRAPTVVMQLEISNRADVLRIANFDNDRLSWLFSMLEHNSELATALQKVVRQNLKDLQNEWNIYSKD